LDLLRLRSATSAYLAIVHGVMPAAEQWADVNRLHEPTYGELLDQLRVALLRHEMGTPAAVARVLSELLGES
jgi:hypothetical protein